MAYQIILMRFIKGEVTSSPSQQLLDALRAHALTPSRGAEEVVLRDGLSVELFTECLSQAETQEIALTFRSTSEELHRLIYSLMAAGGMTALLVDNPTIPLVCDPDHGAHLPESDMADAVVCRSHVDVAHVLVPLCQRWATWAGNQ